MSLSGTRTYLIVGGATLALAYAAFALAAFRRLGDRAWLLLCILLVVASVATAVATGHLPCSRHGPILAALATWCPIVTFFGTATGLGAYVAQEVVEKHARTTISGVALTAAATVVGLAIGLGAAAMVFIGFYGPDCWP